MEEVDQADSRVHVLEESAVVVIGLGRNEMVQGYHVPNYPKRRTETQDQRYQDVCRPGKLGNHIT